MKKTLLPVFLCVLLSGVTASAAEVYRWTDDNGKTMFGDKPPADKTATAVRIDHAQKSGAQFADPVQIKKFERSANKTRPAKKASKKKINANCRRYISQLNKVEIFLEHTNSPRDQLKARDLRKLASKNCGGTPLTQKFSDAYCKRYRRTLSKTEIFLEHTSSPRDEQKVKDLKKQLARECK